MTRFLPLICATCLLPTWLQAQPLDPLVVKRAAAQIDQFMARDYDKAQVIPEGRVDDGIFVRRAYLNIVGRIPTAEEARAYIENRSVSKKEDLIDQLVASPGYESHLFNWMGDLLRVETRTGREKHGLGWHVWLRNSIHEDKPWDDLVREMLGASGHAVENPAVGYYLRDRNMHLDNFSNTMQVFLGQQMGCAQCHDHPFEDWTQYDYYQMAAFGGGMEYRSEDMREMVRRVAEDLKAKKGGDDKAGQNAKQKGRENRNFMRQAGRQMRPFFRVLNNDAISDNPKRQLRLPKDYKYADGEPGEVVEAETLFGPKLEDVPPEKRKEAFANWVTSPENAYFTRTIVNRMWERVFGAPLYDSLDDLKEDSRTAHPELAAKLEEYMVLCNYDLRQFQRILFRTKLFERKCMAKEPVKGEPVFFRGMVLRRMSAEQLYDSFLVLRHGKVDDSINESLAQDWQSHVSMVKAVFDAPAGDLVVLAEAAEEGEKRLREAQTAVRQAQLRLRDAENREQKIKAQEAMREARAQVNEARAQANPLMAMAMMGSSDGRDRKGMLRASELPAPFHPGHMVREFGGSDRQTPSSGKTWATVPQALTLLNNWQTHPLGNPEFYLPRQLAKLESEQAKLDYLFLALFGTKPEPAETSRYVSLAADRQSLNDLATAMVNSKRFIFIQ
ncbi:MAG: DUF1549 domain-containing protein [Akkermansiaceae bacterium]|nr:DUF1549 domain-containing protein [Akkermansiaceae bacterium]